MNRLLVIARWESLAVSQNDDSLVRKPGTSIEEALAWDFFAFFSCSLLLYLLIDIVFNATLPSDWKSCKNFTIDSTSQGKKSLTLIKAQKLFVSAFYVICQTSRKRVKRTSIKIDGTLWCFVVLHYFRKVVSTAWSKFYVLCIMFKFILLKDFVVWHLCLECTMRWITYYRSALIILN